MNIKSDLVKICKLMHSSGLISGTDGNISLRKNENELIVTPSGVNKAFISEEMLITVDKKGKAIDSSAKITSEISMHTLIYSKRPDIGAVLHSHPPYSTAFAVCKKAIPDNLLIEVPVIIGKMCVAEFAVPGTESVANAISPFIEGCNAIFMSNHGVVVYGKDIFEAYNRLEALENAAKTIIYANYAGTPIKISDEDVLKMYERHKY